MKKKLQDIVKYYRLDLEKIENCMQTFNSNIMDSNAYFYTNRHELETPMSQENLCTIWYTLSAADKYWVDLHSLLYKKLHYLTSVILLKRYNGKRTRVPDFHT